MESGQIKQIVQGIIYSSPETMIAIERGHWENVVDIALPIIRENTATEIIQWLDGWCEHTIVQFPEEMGGLTVKLQSRTRWHCPYCHADLKSKYGVT
ncbi:MAG: hypothetical protein PHX07_05865 [Candidatus Marinimicrobia bacterium]|nr:hypothetical protein [Candidatus Neomarinimicrobiota bacterium]